MKAYLALIFMLPLWAKASCQLPGNRTLADGAEVSLFAPGRSMENFKIQDQDGIGSCYANVTSAVLQSVLPRNPEVSYLHASIQVVTNGWRRDWTSGQSYTDLKSSQSISEGGFVCETLAALKNSGGACARNHSILESGSVNPHAQERFFRNLGRYFDVLRVSSNNTEELNRLRQDLSITLESFNENRADIRRECESEKAEEYPVAQAASRLVADVISANQDGSSCGDQRVQAFQNLLTATSVVSVDGVSNLQLKPEFLSRFRELVNNVPNLSSELQRFSNADDAGKQLIGSSLRARLEAVIDSVAPQGSCPSNEVYRDPNLGMKFAEDMVSERRKCRLLSSTLNRVLSDADTACIAPGRLEILLNGLVPFREIGVALDNDLISNLVRPIGENENRLRQTLMPGCEDPANRIPVSNLTCATFSTCDRRDEYSNQTYLGEPRTCYSEEQATTVMRERIFNGIQNNRALGLSVCTAFMKDPAVRTNFCRLPAPGIDGHSYHAMTIAGYRCTGGKLQYEVVNSWGKHCPAKADTQYKNSALECVLDSDGTPTGKFWLNEDVMVNNAKGVTQILSAPR